MRFRLPGHDSEGHSLRDLQHDHSRLVGDSTVGGIPTADEEILDFAGTFGTSTSGIFSLRLDLSSLGISSSEDVDALQVVD